MKKKNSYYEIWIILLILVNYMIFVIYIAFFKKNISSELISKNYYEEEIKYQEVINEKKNANILLKKVKIEIISDGIQIKFPLPFTFKNIIGEYTLLRLSNKKLDLRKRLFLNKYSEKLISYKNLMEGLYNFKLRWYYNGKNYLIEKMIVWKR